MGRCSSEEQDLYTGNRHTKMGSAQLSADHVQYCMYRRIWSRWAWHVCQSGTIGNDDGARHMLIDRLKPERDIKACA